LYFPPVKKTVFPLSTNHLLSSIENEPYSKKILPHVAPFKVSFRKYGTQRYGISNIPTVISCSCQVANAPLSLVTSFVKVPNS
jgi:hypothetical protein